MTVQNNFIVGLNGNCFFCGKRVSSYGSPINLDTINNESFATYSLQWLSRYLQIDISKVFQDEGLTSQPLLSQVKKSKLKAELCPECASINERLAKLYRQLEKIEMDVISGLQIVLGKLGGVVGTGEAELPDIKAELEFSTGKLQFVKALRKETMQKGLEKLDSSFPKIYIQNLTINQVTDRRKDLKMDCCIPGSLLEESSEDILQNGEVSIGIVKFESPFEDSEQNDDDEGKSYSDHLDESSHSAITDDEADNTTAHPVPIKSEANKNEEICISTPKIETTKNDLSCSKSKYTVNSETDTLRCKICSEEFPNYPRFHYHYQTKHLKIIYKCSVCGRIFKQVSQFNTHQKKAHQGVTYKCQVCSQVFPLQSNLMKHQRCNGCPASEAPTLVIIRPPKTNGRIQDLCSLIGKTERVKCSLCSTQLPSISSFRYHYRRVHQQVRYRCTLCQIDFVNRGNYNRHHKLVHLKSPFKCPVCQREFSSQQMCDQHHTNIHMRRMSQW